MPHLLPLSIFILGILLGLVIGLLLAKKRLKRARRGMEELYFLQMKKAKSALKDETSAPDILEEKIRHEEEMAILYSIGQKLSSQLELKSIARILVEEVVRILGVKICALLLPDKTSGALKIIQAVGLGEDIKRETLIKKGEGISGWVMEHNEPLFVRDLEKEPYFNNRKKERYYRQAIISLPLSIKQEVLGVLNVNNKRNDLPFSSRDIRFLYSMAIQASIVLKNAHLYEELKENYLNVIIALAGAIDAKDPYTKRHSENVARYAGLIARKLDRTQAEIEDLKTAALLHDIGKIGIRDGVLNKSQKLTEQEWQELKKHPLKAEEILSSLPFLAEIIAPVRHHHERYDGGGYPDGIRAEAIELPARILAAADTIDAMLTDRPYRKALTVEEVKKELEKNSGRQFDPLVAEAAISILEEIKDTQK